MNGEYIKAMDFDRFYGMAGGVSILGGFASEMTDFNFLHIGSRCVWTPYVILGAALVEIPVFTVLTIRSYCRHSQ